ncbi:MAG: hypothetical protein IPM16_13440 [Chloroflexi bacterium]|nr:hypothetical protein [Chloroflexota bacterium]
MAATSYTYDRAFTRLVDSILCSPGKDFESIRFREWQRTLFFLARRVEDTSVLFEGLYGMRHFLPEGGNLHPWISTYNIAMTRPLKHFHRLRLQVAQAWHLMLVGSLSAAETILCMANDIIKDLPTYRAYPVHVPTRILELDLAAYKLMLRSLRSVGTREINEAVYYRSEANRFGRPAQRGRAELALAAVKFSAGMIESAESNLDSAYRYFEKRNMNTEAGFAAFGLGRFYCDRDGIDPLEHPPGDRGRLWLVKAALHFSNIGLPFGLKLVTPYLRHIEIELPKFEKPVLIPPYDIPPTERFNTN